MVMWGMHRNMLDVQLALIILLQDKACSMQQRVRARQETCNKRLKQWKILREEYRHKLEDHSDVFCAIAVLTQLALESGEPLFEVEYH